MTAPTQQEVSEYLNNLRRSNKTNMLGAVPYILAMFPQLSERDARTMLTTWMREFKECDR